MVRPLAEISSRTNHACQNTQKGSCGVNASAQKLMATARWEHFNPEICLFLRGPGVFMGRTFAQLPTTQQFKKSNTFCFSRVLCRFCSQ